MKQLTVNDLWALIGTLEDYDIPVVIVGGKQVIADAWLVYQKTLDDEDEPVALELQLIPNASS